MARQTFDLQAPSATLLRRLVAEFERLGWRDDGETAFAIVKEVKRQGRCPSQKTLGEIVPSTFLAQNNVSHRALQEACRSVIARP